jgi:hypothetical protein
VPSPDVRAHLVGLVGTAIPTLSGTANRIIRAEDDSVTIGTNNSLAGERVPGRVPIWF